MSLTSSSRHQGVVQFHQALFEFQWHRQQLAPAVGDPAAVVQPVGRQLAAFGLRKVAVLQAFDEFASAFGGGLQVFGIATFWSSSRRVTSAIHRPCLSFSRLEISKRCAPMQRMTIRPGWGMENSVMVASVPTVLKLSLAKAVARGRAGIGGPAYLGAFGERDNAERRTGLVAFADHVEVTDLKNAQRQHAAGVQHRAQRKEGKGAQRQGFWHGLIVLWSAVNHIIPCDPSGELLVRPRFASGAFRGGARRLLS
jgi:hypothetical protein